LKELGRPIPIETFPVGERLPGLPDFVTDLMTVLEMYDSPLDMSETASIYGVEPTTAKTFLRQTLAAAPAA
jgi:hypothetical protein